MSNTRDTDRRGTGSDSGAEAPDSPESGNSLERKLVRTSPVLWVLGLCFALFLGALGTRALMDIAEVFREPTLDEFRQPRVAALVQQEQALRETKNPRAAAIAQAERDLADLERTVSSAEESWRTGLATRSTLGADKEEDRQVRQQRDRLEALRKERDAAQTTLEQMRREPDPRAAALADLEGRIAQGSRAAEDEFAAAHRTYTFKVLAARLGLVAPLLLLAVWLYARRRGSAYLTLLWGYWAFSLWMLLYGIGPYLPHYGGYAPLGLGAAVTVWGAVALSRRFNRRAALRRLRLVDRAIAEHRCPACERDYLIGRETALELGLARKTSVRHFDEEALHPRRCSGCGLALFGPCQSCHKVQVLALSRCASCGAGVDMGAQIC